MANNALMASPAVSEVSKNPIKSTLVTKPSSEIDNVKMKSSGA
jgi:hypothetical protein